MFSRFWLGLSLVACTPTSDRVFADPDRQAIIGGVDADIDDHAHLVSLQTNGRNHFCGGTLIDERWVLTAAHCVAYLQPNSILVESGTSVLGEQQWVHGVQRIVRHPGYSISTHANDIALLELITPITDQAPLALVSRSGAATLAGPGVLATVAGWGDVDLDGADPSQLQSVDVPLIGHSTCEALYHPNRVVLDTMVCAGDTVDGGEDACDGDSGGPLTVDSPDGPVLLGVVSWGMGCAEAGRPGVYTRIPSFVNWIQHHVAGIPLDDFGDSPDQAESLVGGTPVNLGNDDADVLRLDAIGLQDVTLSSTGATALSVELRAADGTLVVSEAGAGDFSFSRRLEGEHYLHITGAPQDFELGFETVVVPQQDSGGCGGDLWATLAASAFNLGRP